MNIKTISTGAVITMTLLSGSLWAAQQYSEEQIRDSLKAYADHLPDGHQLSFEGLQYGLADDELRFKTLNYSWPEITANGKWEPAGQISLTGLTIAEPNLTAFLGTAINADQTVAKYLKWRQFEFNQAERLEISGTDGVISNPSLNLSLVTAETLPRAIRTLNATSARMDRSRFSYEDSQIDGNSVHVSGIVNKVVAKEIAADKVASWVAGNMTMDFKGKAADGRDIAGSGEIDSIKFENLTINADNFVPEAPTDHALAWQTNPELYQVLTQFSQEMRKSQAKNIRYDLMDVAGLKLKITDPENPGAPKVPVKVGHIHMKDVTPTTTGRMLMTDLDIENPQEEVFISMDEVEAADIDLSTLPDFIELLRKNGHENMEQRLAENGFSDMLPSFKLGSLSVKGLNINTPDEDISIGKVGFFDLAKDEAGIMSAGFDLKELAIPAEWIGQKEKPLADMLTERGHKQLTLNALMDLAHNPQEKTLTIDSIELATKELGGANFSALLSNFKIPKSDATAAMTGMFSQIKSAQFTFADRGMVSLIAEMLVPRQPGQSPNSQEMLQALLHAKAQESSSQARIDFFKALGGLALDSGELKLTAKPAKPIAIAEIVMTSNQGGPESVLDLLNVESTHKK